MLNPVKALQIVGATGIALLNGWESVPLSHGSGVTRRVSALRVNGDAVTSTRRTCSRPASDCEAAYARMTTSPAAMNSSMAERINPRSSSAEQTEPGVVRQRDAVNPHGDLSVCRKNELWVR